MARDPGSLWTPLAEWNDQGSFAKDKFIFHSTGDRGSATAIYNYFNRPNVVVESTFVVGLEPSDSTRQLLDSTARADANLSANTTAISAEFVGRAEDPFTDWQVAEAIRLGKWAHAAHDIPKQLIPSPAGAGFGWHIMFGSPGPWTGVAKECPGKKRIKQLKDTILPAIFDGAAVPTPAAPPAGRPPALGWNLPRGHFYGHIKGPAKSHGGFYASERPAIKIIQQWLIYRGCVPGIDPSRWASSTWADGLWEDPTSAAMRLWHDRYYRNQPYPDQCWSDDLARLTA
jgi:hypothetical protein